MATQVKSRDQVLEQVQKLLRLADADKNSSESEASTAMQLAHELLEQHGLDMAEVHMEEDSGWDVIDWKDEPKSQYDTWNKTLGFAATLLFNCQPYISRCGWNKTREYRLVSFGIIGESTDVAMAREVWPWLVKTCRRLARAYGGKGWNSTHRSFAEAFATRVWMRSEQMRIADLEKKEAERTVKVTQEDGTVVEKEICTALVVTEKKEAIKQWLEEQGIKFKQTPARSNTGKYDRYAGAAGNEAGKNVNLDFKRQVSGGQNQKKID